MKKDPYCYLNGKIARLSALRFPPNDLGVLRGYGLFDYLRTVEGKPVLLREHLARFKRSAVYLGLSIPVSTKVLISITEQLIRKNGFKETGIKFVLTGGPSQDGKSITGAPTFFVLAAEEHEPPEQFYQQGVHLKTFEYLRLLPEVKTTSYIMSVRHQHELNTKGILELLYIHNGHVLECSSSNVFIVKGNTLITPKKNILIGTTRNKLIQVARKKYKIEERDIRIPELRTADEVFITASNKSVMPVVKIDTYRIGKGMVGPVARELRALYEKSIRARV